MSERTPMEYYATDIEAAYKLYEHDVLTIDQYNALKKRMTDQLNKDLVEAGVFDNEIVRATN
jgi:CO dehydrogenase/acetyl-CoA synthase delta subunit